MTNLTLLPLKFGNILLLRPLTWSDFPGQVDERLPWAAHIFWSIQYKIVDYEKHKISVSLIISKRSWVRQQKKCDHLLNHQQGHYLIGALCVLEFMRRIGLKKKSSSNYTFAEMVNIIFQRTIKEFLELQRKYDSQTEHRMNYQTQEQWDIYLKKKLLYYHQIFDKKASQTIGLPRVKVNK